MRLAMLKMAEVTFQVVFAMEPTILQKDQSLIVQRVSLIITKATTIFQKDQPLTVLTMDSKAAVALLINRLFMLQPAAKVEVVT